MTFDYTDGICDVDMTLTPGIVQPWSTASDALSTNGAPDINDMNLISGDVIITQNDDAEMVAKKEQSEKRNKPKSAK